MARFIEARRLDETVIHINADRVDFVYDAPTRKGQAVVNFGKGHEIGIQMSAKGLPRQGKGPGRGHAPSPLPAAVDRRRQRRPSLPARLNGARVGVPSPWTAR
jgi:hypothetical protein